MRHKPHRLLLRAFCPVCGNYTPPRLHGGNPFKYCSEPCRRSATLELQRAWRQRRQKSLDLP